MKHKILRRIGAFALCLVLVMGLAAPSLAEDDAGPGENDEPVVVTKIEIDELDENERSIPIGGTVTLHATTTPSGAAVTWSSGNTDVATVDGNGVVTGKAAGTAMITATANGLTASCDVTVRNPIRVVSMDFPFDEIQFNFTDNTERSISVELYPANADYKTIEFRSEDENIVTVRNETSDTMDVRRYARLTAIGPGETYITADLKGMDGQPGINQLRSRVTVSGIVVTDRNGNVLDRKIDAKALPLVMGTSENVSVTTYGDAKNISLIEWYSSDPAVVSVASGRLTPRSPGNAEITVMRGNYAVSFNVNVREDTSRLVEATGSIRAGAPYSLQGLISKIRTTCENYWLEQQDIETTKHTLSYITSLSITPEQGILYRGYISEADTGSGVSMTQRYYYNGGTSDDYRISDLTFVPRSTFSGTAEIAFTGVSDRNGTMSGVIRLSVDAMEDVSYTTGSGQNVFFLGSDFNTVCRARTGRELASVTFTLPESSRGTMYYNYTTSGQYSEKVEAGTSYRRVGNPNIDGVSFLPADGFSGTVRISYHGLDTAGGSFSGYVTIDVTDRGSGDADVVFSARYGREVNFTSAKFNTACRDATGDNLEYVQFSLPLSSEGTLYYNRGSSSESRVSSSQTYYRSPGFSDRSLANVSFVPALNAPDQITIPFSGRSVGETNFSGTILIDYSGTSSTPTVRYSVYSGHAVQFESADFNTACRSATGSTLRYVTFTLPSAVQGTLCYNYSSTSALNTVKTSTRYYSGSTTTGNRLDNVWFLAADGYAGTVNISYTGYSNSNESFTGTVTVQVGALTPNDVSFSGTGAQAISLVSSQIRSACNAVLDSDLSYIQFTSLPPGNYGRLYRDYSGFDSGTQVVTGTPYYVAGTPGIDQLCFVPRGGFTGTAAATYTGVSASGEKVSGRINFVVSASGSSTYFNDMGGYSWAAAAVDYMQRNGVINGIGNGQYGPGQSIRRCDFVVMLCRAYGISDGGDRYVFADVPADSYYAAAVSAASRRGIVSGDGTNFFPNSQLTRQDAMVIIKNTLEQVGWSLSGGSTEELSYFGDGGSVAAYARDAVATLIRLGAINGDNNGNLRPWDPVTRAEAAVMLHFVMTM